MKITAKLLWAILGAVLGSGAFLGFFRLISKSDFSGVLNVAGLYALIGAVLLPWLVGRYSKKPTKRPRTPAPPKPVAKKAKPAKKKPAETPPRPASDQAKAGKSDA